MPGFTRIQLAKSGRSLQAQQASHITKVEFFVPLHIWVLGRCRRIDFRKTPVPTSSGGAEGEPQTATIPPSPLALLVPFSRYYEVTYLLALLLAVGVPTPVLTAARPITYLLLTGSQLVCTQKRQKPTNPVVAPPLVPYLWLRNPGKVSTFFSLSAQRPPPSITCLFPALSPLAMKSFGEEGGGRI